MSRAAYAREWAKGRTLEQIETKRKSAKAWREKNMPTVVAKQKEWRDNNREAVRTNVRRNVRKALYARYGLAPGEYEKILSEQNGRCAICGNEPKGERPLSVDHCHDSGKVRGLLCHGCNTGIGFLKDDVGLLKKAIKYLNKKGKVS